MPTPSVLQGASLILLDTPHPASPLAVSTGAPHYLFLFFCINLGVSCFVILRLTYPHPSG